MEPSPTGPYSLQSLLRTIRLSIPLSSVSVSHYQHLPHALDLPGQLFTARREETQLSSSLGSADDTNVYNGFQKPWLCLDCANAIGTAEGFGCSARTGEKRILFAKLWFAQCMAQLQVLITQLWGPHLPPSNPRSSFLNLPEPMYDRTGAQTSAQGRRC